MTLTSVKLVNAHNLQQLLWKVTPSKEQPLFALPQCLVA